MIKSENSQQNLSDYSQFLFKNRSEVNKKRIIFSSEKMSNSGSGIYD